MNAQQQLDHESPTGTQGARAQSVLISGATGLVGTALQQRLVADQRNSTTLHRSSALTNPPVWNPSEGRIDLGESLYDAVIHLAGENIASGRWTTSKMQAIRESRVAGTKLLCEALANSPTPPKTLICASAIGYYGDRGDEILSEDSSAGTGFLPDVCASWEAATRAAEDAGIRVVKFRIGIVLDPKGGALAKMLLPFRLGAGGKLGSGSQYMSWITTDDLVSAIATALDDERYRGPINAVSPNPVTNLEFTKTLGKALRRPTIAPMPAFAARMAFGKLADALLLGSTRVAPKRLEELGFRYSDSSLEPALRRLLNKPAG